jgi:hypothetical protein
MWIVIALVAAYLLSRQPGTQRPPNAIARPSSAAPPGGAFFSTIGAQLQIAIPNVGSYTNIGGGSGSQIRLDPGLWGSIFGAGAAQPVPVTSVAAPADLGYLPQTQLPADVGAFYL